MSITREEIEALGFTYSDTLSTSEMATYLYVVDRAGDRGKPYGTQNVYRLDNPVSTDYYSLISDLQRKPEFEMWTRGFNGPLDTITELFNIFDNFKEANKKI